MDPATTLALIQTILTAIQTLAQLQSLFSISHCRSELDDLQNTVETVRAVLQDADASQDSLNAQEKHYIQELKDAICDADDVLDEFLTLAKQNQLRRNKANGWARIKIGGTDIIASVKAELGRSNSSRPDHGKGKGGEELSSELTLALQRGLLGSKSGAGCSEPYASTKSAGHCC